MGIERKTERTRGKEGVRKTERQIERERWNTSLE